MAGSVLDVDGLLRRAADLARSIGARRFANRPGKLTQLLHQISDPPDGLVDAVRAPELETALTLVPLARHQLDEIELGLLTQARRAGLSWAKIAQQLSLGSRQAAEQRYLRLQAVHAAGASERDPRSARQQRHQHAVFAEQLTNAAPLINRLANVLPDALEDSVYANPLEPAPELRPGAWDELPFTNRGFTADLLTGLFEPHLRAVRAAARADDLSRRFRAVTHLLELLHHHPQVLNYLPSEVFSDVVSLTNTAATMGRIAPDLVPPAFRRLPSPPGPRRA